MGFTKEQIAQLGIRPRVRKGRGLLPCERKEAKAVIRAILNDKDSDELWQFWRLIPFEEGYACQQRKLFEAWVKDEVENMWYDIGRPEFDEDGNWSCPEGGWWPYLKTRYLDISWLKVGNAIIDMDEVWTTLRNYLEEKVQGYRMCPGLMLYRTVQAWLVTRKECAEKRTPGAMNCLADLEKEMEELVKTYPTETTKKVDDRVYYDLMPHRMFMLPKVNERK
jgi:hypothetical protein